MGFKTTIFYRFGDRQYMNKSRRTKILSALSAIPIFILLAFFLFTPENIDIMKSVFTKELSNAEIQEMLRGLGWRGQITITILSMLQVIIAVLPAEPAQVLAGLTFGFGMGTLCCVAGVILGNSVIFLLYKIFGDRMRGYFDKKLDIDLTEVSSSKFLALAILILYILPAIPYGMICFIAASTNMKYPRFIILTALGSIPSVCIGVGLGHMALETSWIVSVAIFLVLVLILALIMRKRDFIFGKLNALIHTARDPYSSKTTVRKSYGEWKLSIGYFVFRLLTFTKIKYRVERPEEPIERPSIVLCNHGAFIDFAYTGSILKKEKPHFIVARLYFYHRWLGFLLRQVGAFPKSMFTTDTESAMNCVRVIKGGGVLAMMPEARLSTVGKFEDIQPGTFDFLKKMGVTVYNIKIRGDYLAKPKWASGIRRGALVEARLEKLFTPEELATLDVSEIRRRTEDAIRYDEFEWLEEHPKVRYKSRKMAKGLENILTVCPSCGARHSISTKGRRVFCEKCDLSTEVDTRYKFTEGFRFKNFAEWYEWQTKTMESEIMENESFALSSKVTLKHASENGQGLLRHAGEGVCTLTREGLTYRGTEFGQTIEKHFPIGSIYRLLFGAGEDFEVYMGKEIFYFTPEERRSCVDWYITSRILYDIKDNQK